MNSLASPKVKAFLEGVERIHQQCALSEFPARIFEVVRGMIPDVVMTMDEFDVKTGVARDAISHAPKDYAAWKARLDEIVPIENPCYPAIMNGARDVLVISDFLSDRQLRRTAFFNDVLKPIGTRYQLVIPLMLPGHVAGVTLNRHADFSEAERTMACLLAPQIALAHVNAHRFTALHRLKEHPLPDDETLHGLGLTPREAEIMHWLIKGKTDPEMANFLGGSVRTIQTHVRSILLKLKVHTRTDAAISAIEARIRNAGL